MLYYILIVIVIVILILFIFLFIKNKEQFKSDYSDYNSIDRIKIHTNDAIDVNNEYAINKNVEKDMFAYCIGATPRCENGVPIKIGVYQNGNTYKSTCDDGSNMICKNFMSTNSENVFTTPNNTKIMFSDTYKGFTEPTTYVPAVINEKIINFYDNNNKLLDTINKCSILGSDTNNCNKAINIPFTFANKNTHILYNYAFENTNVSGVYDPDSINASTGYNVESIPDIGSFTSYTEKTPKSNGKSGMYPNLPCIADYGSQPGDNVCNGEIGLIQDNTLVCPYYKPICQGYRCDSNFGKCTYSK
jgi:hypothetical protein